MQDMSAGHSLLVASGTPFPLDLNESRTKVVESGDTAVPIRPIFPPNLSFSFPSPSFSCLLRSSTRIPGDASQPDQGTTQVNEGSRALRCETPISL